MMRTLGIGSFGRVKLARHAESGTVMALKILQVFYFFQNYFYFSK